MLKLEDKKPPWISIPQKFIAYTMNQSLVTRSMNIAETLSQANIAVELLPFVPGL